MTELATKKVTVVKAPNSAQAYRALAASTWSAENITSPEDALALKDAAFLDATPAPVLQPTLAGIPDPDPLQQPDPRDTGFDPGP